MLNTLDRLFAKRIPWTSLWVCMLCACSRQTLDGGLLVDRPDSGPDASLATDAPATVPQGGAGGLLSGGTGGTLASGGTGGTSASGGAGGTSASGGAGSGGSASCTNPVSASPCGGDVVGTWTVAPSCLAVAGEMDLSPLGLECQTGSVTGTLQVTGTWTATPDGKYIDQTILKGAEQITLGPKCLNVSGTTTTCDVISSVIVALGFASVTCKSADGGGCTCAATINQTGGMGLQSPQPSTTGTYTTSNGTLAYSDGTKASYCVTGNRMAWTPQGAGPVVTGTIALTKSRGAGAAKLPCDIYADEGGPCVAAHSTVRALLATYDGPLYQVRRTDGATKDIPLLAPGGMADSSVQDAFCADDACTISIIYDQSGRQNHLAKAPPGGAKATAGKEADASALPIVAGGKKVYGEHNPPGVGYRNNSASGTAEGDNPETIYMVVGGDYYNGGCCFDYGNAERSSTDNGEGATEAVYFGACTIWGKGAGEGPWVMGDLENGLWAGNATPYEGNSPVKSKYVTGMVKGDKAGANHWVIKAGNAQAGSLSKHFDGQRPSSRYNPMRKEGAIILGTAGDNNNAGQGDFFEGVMTAHFSSDAADDAVQASIVSVYGP